MVYLNGKNVLNHTGGHLSFETYATRDPKYGENNLITVAVDNRLSSKTIPQGSVEYRNDTSLYPKGFYESMH
jgi:beta-glucuronidase